MDFGGFIEEWFGPFPILAVPSLLAQDDMVILFLFLTQEFEFIITQGLGLLTSLGKLIFITYWEGLLNTLYNIVV